MNLKGLLFISVSSDIRFGEFVLFVRFVRVIVMLVGVFLLVEVFLKFMVR